jgi:hypothetical protein
MRVALREGLLSDAGCLLAETFLGTCSRLGVEMGYFSYFGGWNGLVWALSCCLQGPERPNDCGKRRAFSENRGEFERFILRCGCSRAL